MIFAELWDLLKGHTEMITGRVYAKHYPTREAAIEALQLACYVVARRRAEIIEAGGMVNTEFESIYGRE